MLIKCRFSVILEYNLDDDVCDRYIMFYGSALLVIPVCGMLLLIVDPIGYSAYKNI